MVENVSRGFESDMISDNEIIDTVEEVKKVLEKEHEVIPIRISRKLLQCFNPSYLDCIYNLCEGLEENTFAEPYVAGFLDMLNIPYTGSNSFTLALCQDKIKTKQILKSCGLHTPDYRVFKNTDNIIDASSMNFPLIVKPANEDASVGISFDSVVHDMEALIKKVDYILTNYRQPAIVEEYIDGREINVSVIGNGNNIQVLPVSEIIFNIPKELPKVVCYEAKWMKDSVMFQGTIGTCPAVIDEPVLERINREAIEAYRVTGCRDYARVDMRLRDGIPYILEVNPNPGKYIDSGFVRSACAAGMDYSQLINRIFSMAMERYGIEVTPSSDIHYSSHTAPSSDIPHCFNGTKSSNKNIFHESDGLIARAVNYNDVPFLLEWFNDPDVSEYMDNPSYRYTRDELVHKLFLSGSDDLDCMILEKDTMHPVGFASVYDISDADGSGEISFLIGNSRYRGKGFGKQSVSLITEAGFKSIGLKKLKCNVVENNIPSIKALKAAGFIETGKVFSGHRVNGKSFPLVHLELSFH